MNQKAIDWFCEVKNKSITLIGLGVSHRDLAELLAKKGLNVSVVDKRAREQVGEELVSSLENLGVRFTFGADYLDNLSGDIIFRSPGVDWNNPQLQVAKKKGSVITSEVETFFRLCPCRIIAITGSDGKTTTTTLISEILKKQGYTVHLGGNIGYPLLTQIEDVKDEDFAVVELSSFQLVSMNQSPDVAVITNVSPNHLDVHKTMDAYIDAKKNIFRHQDGYGMTVLNQDNAVTASFAPETRGLVKTFSRRQVVKNGAWYDEKAGVLFYSDNGSQTKIMASSDIRIPGIHNVENYLAAISAVWPYVSVDAIVDVAKNFGGVEHRIEFVRELDGVTYYNDSIATSPTRTIAGLNSFNQKIIIIAGGYDKKIPYEPLAPYLIDKVKLLILTGATAPKIEEAAKSHPDFEKSGLKILHAKDMEEAVTLARDNAVSGDIVSLSPASASFDCYPNFEVRGRHYKQLVNAL